MMGTRPAWLFALGATAMTATLIVGARAQDRAGQPPPRDTSARQPPDTQARAGRITGRVLTADTGRPVKRARVFLSGTELPGGRGALTDDDGGYDLTELPEGRYSLTVSKTGFISLSYGQRRPLQAGTPLQLDAGQHLTGVDFRLPRGSAIAGHIFDESGDPLPGANVRVMRYEYAQGLRTLAPAGAAQTDDQGYYRVWGLNPGDYYVNADIRTFGGGGRGGFGPGPNFPGGRGGRGGFGPAGPAADAPEQVGYAPTFYPGVPSVNDARPVAVQLGADALNIDFGVLLVRTARISGHVTNPDGSPTTAGSITLLPEGAQAGRAGMTFVGRIQWDGAFALQNVPPGRYTLRAVGTDTDLPQFAVQPITTGEADIPDLTVILAPGATISGSVTFQNTQSTRVPDLSQLRIVAPAADVAPIGPNLAARVDKDGTFTIYGVPAGSHWIRTQGPLRGWVLKSVMVDGRDVTDTPLDVRSGGRIGGVNVTFTDRLTEVNGTLADDRGRPITEFTVLAFPTDPDLWRPQARQIMTARPDQNGKYQIGGLPPGDYYLAAVDPAEPNEWFEPAFLDQHRAGAAHVTLGEGDTKTQDFTVDAAR